jgi:DNA-binding NarL/FixJ family response regulator
MGNTGALTRVLIADDRAQVREGLRNMLELDQGLEVVGEARNGREAVYLVGERTPDVVLMDVRMPVMDGLEAARLIKRGWPEVRVVVLTVHAAYRSEAFAAGADFFMTKGCPVRELLGVISPEQIAG